MVRPGLQSKMPRGGLGRPAYGSLLIFYAACSRTGRQKGIARRWCRHGTGRYRNRAEKVRLGEVEAGRREDSKIWRRRLRAEVRNGHGAAHRHRRRPMLARQPEEGATRAEDESQL